MSFVYGFDRFQLDYHLVFNENIRSETLIEFYLMVFYRNADLTFDGQPRLSSS